MPRLHVRERFTFFTTVAAGGMGRRERDSENAPAAGRRLAWAHRAGAHRSAAWRGLLVTFALSGHAAAVPQAELGFALSVDILHLLGSAAWVGGLFYISIILIPALVHMRCQSSGVVEHASAQ